MDVGLADDQSACRFTNLVISMAPLFSLLAIGFIFELSLKIKGITNANSLLQSQWFFLYQSKSFEIVF